MTITLTTSFNYNATNNLLIQVATLNGAYVEGQDLQFKAHGTNSTMTRYSHRDEIGTYDFGNVADWNVIDNDWGSLEGTTSRPNIRLTFNYTPNETDPPLPARLVSPVNGATFVPTTTALTWSAGIGNTPSGYKVYLSTTNPPPTTTAQYDITQTTITPEGLTEGATYYWQVVPYNTNGDATSCPVWSFTTSSGANTTPFVEDWEDGYNRWALVNGTTVNQWVLGGVTYTGSGTHSMYISNNGTTNSYSNDVNSLVYFYTDIAFPANATSILFSFDYKGTGEGYYDFTRVYLMPISETPIASASNFSAFGANDPYYTYRIGGEKYNLTSNWTNYQIPLDNSWFGETGRLVFCWTNDDSQGSNPASAIDNISVIAMYADEPPLPAVLVSPVSGAVYLPITTVLTWTAGLGNPPTGYNLYISTTNPPPTVIAQYTGSQTTFTPDNLILNTTYYWQVVPVNAGGSATGCPVWSFTTAPLPNTTPFIEDWEDGGSRWGIANGTTVNKWVLGEATHTGEGTHSMYVSNTNGSTNTYTTSSAPTVIHFFTDISFPANATSLVLNFDYKGIGETTAALGTSWDYTRVYLMPTSIIPVASTTAFNTNGTSGGEDPNLAYIIGDTQYNMISEWTNYQITINNSWLGQTGRLVFSWINDSGGGANPPSAIDNITVIPIMSGDPPLPAQIVSPASGASQVSINTALVWQAPSLGPARNGYTLYIGTTNPISTQGIDVGNVTSYTTSSLTNNTQYFWQVVPYTTVGGNALNCPVWSFTTQLACDIEVASFSVSGVFALLPSTSFPFTLRNNGSENILASGYTITVYENNTPLNINFSNQNINSGQVANFTITAADLAGAGFTTRNGALALRLAVTMIGDEAPGNNEAIVNTYITDAIAEVGAGVTGNPTTPKDDYPFNTNYRESVVQSIYRASDLGDVTTGTITHIMYQFTRTNDERQGSYPVNIWMANTTGRATGFAETDDWEPQNEMTQVVTNYDLGLNTLAAGSYEIWIPLSTPFLYTGGDVVIMTSKIHLTYINATNVFTQTNTIANSNVTISKRTDTVGSYTAPFSTGSYTRDQFKPQIRFAFTLEGGATEEGEIAITSFTGPSIIPAAEENMVINVVNQSSAIPIFASEYTVTIREATGSAPLYTVNSSSGNPDGIVTGDMAANSFATHEIVIPPAIYNLWSYEGSGATTLIAEVTYASDTDDTNNSAELATQIRSPYQLLLSSFTAPTLIPSVTPIAITIANNGRAVVGAGSYTVEIYQDFTLAGNPDPVPVHQLLYKIGDTSANPPANENAVSIALGTQHLYNNLTADYNNWPYHANSPATFTLRAVLTYSDGGEEPVVVTTDLIGRSLRPQHDLALTTFTAPAMVPTFADIIIPIENNGRHVVAAEDYEVKLYQVVNTVETLLYCFGGVGGDEITQELGLAEVKDFVVPVSAIREAVLSLPTGPFTFRAVVVYIEDTVNTNNNQYISSAKSDLYTDGIVEIGIGGYDTQNTLPFNTYYHDTVTQSVYRAAEIGSGVEGLITHIMYKFQRGSGNIISPYPVHIYMANTAANAIPATGFTTTGWLPQAQFTQITPPIETTSPTPQLVGGGYDLGLNALTTQNNPHEIWIPLATPFAYTGGDLVIMTYKDHHEQPGDTNRFFQTSSVPNSNMSLHKRKDADSGSSPAYNPTNLTSGTGSQLQYKPQMRFAFTIPSELDIDLAVTTFTVPALLPSSDLQVTVTNLGGNQANGYDVSIYQVSDNTPSLLYSIPAGDIVALTGAVGATFDAHTYNIPATIYNTWWGSNVPAGAITLRAEVTTQNDANQNNDTRNVQTTLRPAYDLAVTSVSGTTLFPTLQPLNITVQNNGRAIVTAGTYTVAVSINNGDTFHTITATETLVLGGWMVYNVPYTTLNQSVVGLTGNFTFTATIFSAVSEDITTNNSGAHTSSIITGFTTDGIAEVDISNNNLTISSSGSGNTMPISTYYFDSIAQSIYRNSELGGIDAGLITHINYRYSNANNTPLPSTMSIYMANIVKTGFTSTTDWVPYSEFTLVKGFFDMTANLPMGVHEIWIELDTPFMYAGNDLVVYTHKSTADGYNSNNGFYQTTTIPDSRVSLSRAADNPSGTGVAGTFNVQNPSLGTANSMGLAVFNFKPQMRFAFILGNYGIVSGNITNLATHAALSGVRVAQGDVYTTSNATGGYILLIDRNTAAENIIFTKEGFHPATVTISELTDLWVTDPEGLATAVKDVEMESATGATVLGVVTFADSGEPVVGVTVQIGSSTAVTVAGTGAYSISGLYPFTAYPVSVTLPATISGYLDYIDELTFTETTNNTFTYNITIAEDMLTPLYASASIKPDGEREVRWFNANSNVRDFTLRVEGQTTNRDYGQGVFVAAQRWRATFLMNPVNALVGNYLTSVWFAPAENSNNFTLMIWVGADLITPDVNNPTYSQDISYRALGGNFNEIVLNKPILITGNEDIVIGIRSTDIPLFTYYSSLVTTNSLNDVANKYYNNGVWTSIQAVSSSFADNWAFHTTFIGAPITSPAPLRSVGDVRKSKSIALLEGDEHAFSIAPPIHRNSANSTRAFNSTYNVYRLLSGIELGAMDIPLNAMPNAETNFYNTYIDNSPDIPGDYRYAVTAIYTGVTYPAGMESAPVYTNIPDLEEQPPEQILPPVNLTATVLQINNTQYNVVLTWDSPGSPVRGQYRKGRALQAMQGSFDLPDANNTRAMLGYLVYRNNELITPYPIASLTFTNYSVPSGTHTYEVSAVYFSEESSRAVCSGVMVENMLPPTGLVANVNGINVTLTWGSNGRGEVGDQLRAAPSANMQNGRIDAKEGNGTRAFGGYRVYRNDVALTITPSNVTTYTDQNVPAGSHTYRVVAIYTSGESSGVTATVSVYHFLPPQNIVLSIARNVSVTFSWDAPFGVVSYQAYRRVGPTGDYDLLAGNITGASLPFVDTTVIWDGTTYYYNFTATYPGSLVSAHSPNMNFIADSVLPPANLQVSVQSYNVTLQWASGNRSEDDEPTRAFTGYNVYRDATLLTPAPITALTHTDNNVAPGTYTYRVTAVYTSGEASISSEPVIVYNLLPPTSLQHTVILGQSITLSWTAPTEAELTNYRVYRKIGTGEFVQIHQTEGTTPLTYIDATVIWNGDTYQYYVKALYPTGESEPTNTIIVDADSMLPPTNLTYSVSDYNVSLQWGSRVEIEPTRALLGYNVYRNSILLTTGTPINALTYTDEGVPAGTYSYQVRAVYTSGQSSPIEVTGVVVYNLQPPTNLQLSTVASQTVALSWQAPSITGFSGYKVYRRTETAEEFTEIHQTTTLTYTDVTVVCNGIPYYYYIAAVYPTGEGRSNTLSARPSIIVDPSWSDNFLSNTLPPGWTNNGGWGFAGGYIYTSGTEMLITPMLRLTDTPMVFTYTVMGTSNLLTDFFILISTTGVNPQDFTTSLPFDITGTTMQTKIVNLSPYTGETIFIAFQKMPGGGSLYIRTVNIDTPEIMPPIIQPPTIGFNSVTLNWDIIDTNVATLSGYTIKRDDVVLSANRPIEPRTYTDNTAQNEMEYTYTVVALYTNPTTEADDSVTAQLKAFRPPTNLTASYANSQVSLNWTIPTHAHLATLIGFTIYRNDNLYSEDSNPYQQSFTDVNVATNTGYTYEVMARYMNPDGFSDRSTPVTVVSDHDEVVVPMTTALQGNYPNPFNPSTVLSFSLTRTESVQIDIYSINGQLVKSLVNGVYGVGVHNVVWNGLADDGHQVSSGVYFYRMRAGDYVGVRKMMLLK